MKIRTTVYIDEEVLMNTKIECLKMKKVNVSVIAEAGLKNFLKFRKESKKRATKSRNS